MTDKRLYISADIEGIAGVVTPEQLGPEGFEYNEARRWMTAEVRMACEAAFENGITEVVVSDSHGNGQNLLLDDLPSTVQVVRSWPRALGMMEGIEVGTYVGAMFIGYHNGITDREGVLSHTLSSRGISEVRLNGMVASETVISAAIGAHFGVPIILATGDSAYAKHVNDVLPTCETVTTKWSSSHISARCILPKDAQKLIYAGAVTSLSRLDEFPVFKLPSIDQEGIQLDVRCLKRAAAELFGYLEMVEQIDSHSVRYVGKDMVEISKFLSFITSCGILTQ